MESPYLFLLAVGGAALFCETAAGQSTSLVPRKKLLHSRQAALANGVPVQENHDEFQMTSRQGNIACDDDRSEHSEYGYVYCQCSPTGGSVSKDAKNFLDKESWEIHEFMLEMDESGIEAAVILDTAADMYLDALEACYNKFDIVTCMDAEASERVLGDRTSGSLYCLWDVKTGANLGDDSNGDREDACAGDTRLVQRDVCKAGGRGGPSPSEGCVDARVLPSCRRIHSHDITADVLCARGLCATPNHELQVDGSRTSMRVFCDSAVCTEARMLVNTCYYRDLQGDGLFVHAASGIGVTSWDVRFPRFATMLVQDAMIMSRAVGAYFNVGMRSEL